MHGNPQGEQGTEVCSCTATPMNRGRRCVHPIVGKAVNLAHDVNAEALGLMDSMAFFKCDDCVKAHRSR